MAVREERGLDCEFRCRRPDGSDAWVFASVVPMRNEASEITAYLGNLVDITFRKEAEAELRRLNAQLEALATTDALTGLPNRRAMLGHLAALWAAAQRYNEPLSCLMLDIDRFKDVNDGYGHAAGDAALREIAVTLRRAARQSDICGRFGGEEFLVLCPRTELEDALAVAERIRQAIESQAIRFEVYEIAVTVSIGTACCRSQADDSQTLIAAADEQLYAAKRGGRNCTRAAYCA
jgi:diguanylate cyclase (GGDEF)-like protein